MRKIRTLDFDLCASRDPLILLIYLIAADYTSLQLIVNHYNHYYHFRFVGKATTYERPGKTDYQESVPMLQMPQKPRSLR